MRCLQPEELKGIAFRSEHQIWLKQSGEGAYNFQDLRLTTSTPNPFIRHHADVQGHVNKDNLDAYDDFHFQLPHIIAPCPVLHPFRKKRTIDPCSNETSLIPVG